MPTTPTLHAPDYRRPCPFSDGADRSRPGKYLLRGRLVKQIPSALPSSSWPAPGNAAFQQRDPHRPEIVRVAATKLTSCGSSNPDGPGEKGA